MNPFFLRIVREPWAINPEIAETYLDSLIKLTEGKLVFSGNVADFEPRILQGKPNTKIIPKAASLNGRSGNGISGQGTVSLIPITTPLMKYDQECGPRGMITIGNYIKAAAADASVSGIILFLDSPGGTVAGTQALGDIIRSVEKPIFAFVSDMAASAAYWLASCCDMIIAENTNAQVGSIGVMMSFQDMKPALERAGVKFHTILSSLSEDKNQYSTELEAGNYESYRTNVLDPLAQTFRDTVMSGRGGKITDETILKGRMEFATKAIELGLVDQIASLDATVEMVLSYEKHPPKTNNPKSKMKTKLPLMLAALGVAELAVDSEGFVALGEEQLAAIEAVVVAANAATATATEALTAAATAAETLTATIATQTGEIVQLKAEKAAILSGAAEKGATIVVEKEASTVTKHADLAAMEGMSAEEQFAYMQEKGYQSKS